MTWEKPGTLRPEWRAIEPPRGGSSLSQSDRSRIDLAPLVILQDDGILRTALRGLKKPTLIQRVGIGHHGLVGLIKPEDRRGQDYAVPQPAAEISIHADSHLDTL